MKVGDESKLWYKNDETDADSVQSIEVNREKLGREIVQVNDSKKRLEPRSNGSFRALVLTFSPTSSRCLRRFPTCLRWTDGHLLVWV